MNKTSGMIGANPKKEARKFGQQASKLLSTGGKYSILTESTLFHHYLYFGFTWNKIYIPISPPIMAPTNPPWRTEVTKLTSAE